MKNFISKITKSLLTTLLVVPALSACKNMPPIEQTSPLLGAYLQGSSVLEGNFLESDPFEFNLSKTFQPQIEFIEQLDFQWVEEGVQWTQTTAVDLFDFEMPVVDIPELNIPDVALPTISLPEVSLPDVSLIGSILPVTEAEEVKELQSNKNESFLTKKNLVKANLMDADLSKIDLSGKDLSSADLRGSDLSHADLTGANL
ncbi:MAG: pentapeptide repeat-containing protein, partial [bacterium]